MSMDVPTAMQRRSRGPLLIAVLALLAAFAVLLLNGAPLFYRDTLGYLDKGTGLLRMLLPDGWLVQVPATAAVPVADGDAAAAGGGGPTVNASRSMLFALFLSILYNARLLLLFPVIGALAVLAALWLPMRVAVRRIEGAPPLGLLVGLPLLAAAAGSLPFYVAYLMPDIFAPVLILICATLFAFAPDMRRWEILLAAAIGLAAILVHPSHLLIAAAMVPVLLVGAVLVRRRGWWIAPLVVAALVLWQARGSGCCFAARSRGRQSMK